MRTALCSAFALLAFLAFGQPAYSPTTVKEVDSLIQVSKGLTNEGDLQKALEINQLAEKLALEKLGPESAAYGKTRYNHGRVEHFNNNYPEAERSYLQAEEILRKAAGDNRKDHEACLQNLGILYFALQDFPKSESFYLQALTVLEKTVGKQHADYATAAFNLGLLYFTIADYDRAEARYLEAKDILSATVGTTHPHYLGCIINIASLYSYLERYEMAERYHFEVRNTLEQMGLSESPYYSGNLINLGSMYQSMGDHRKAERILAEAKAIVTKTLGTEDPSYALCVYNQAGLYSNMNNHKAAEALYLEAMSIQEKVLGKQHQDYVKSLSGLANTYLQMEETEKATAFFLEARTLGEQVLGPTHPDHLTTTSNLALLYDKTGQFEKAESLFLENLSNIEKSVGRNNHLYAINLNNLASLYLSSGNAPKGSSLLQQAEAIWGQQHSRESQDYVHCLLNLALLDLRADDLAAASRRHREAGQIQQSLLLRAAKHLTERELTLLVLDFSHDLDAYLSLAVQIPNDPDYLGFCADNLLFYKGFLLNVAHQVRNSTMSDSLLGDKMDQLRSLHHRLAVQYSSPDAERDPAGIADLENRANALEKELTNSITDFEQIFRQVNWKEVRATLANEEAAIEFVRVVENDTARYAAFVVRRDASAPKFVALIQESVLKSLLGGRHKSEKEKSPPNPGLYANSARGAKPVRPADYGTRLFNALWKPLEPALAGIKKIYFSPAGLLHQINLKAVQVPGKPGVLADEYDLVQVGSTRQLVLPDNRQRISNTAVLFGGLSYAPDMATTRAPSPPSEAVEDLLGSPHFTAFRGSGDEGSTWAFLPETRAEVAEIAHLLEQKSYSARVFQGADGTEEAFKSIGSSHGVTSSHPVTRSPRVLHLATHGFFFPDPAPQRGEFATDSTLWGGRGAAHPMIRSGLILAGGNHAWATGKPLREGMEDGILTAYEISQMNLSNTELVVLSACETGLGDISGNEGVYGLQRAFKIAGAKYLIMSLWQVPDKQTSLLMTTFYKKWLEDKMAVPEAFRAAQKELREAGLDPYQWAGFVLVE